MNSASLRGIQVEQQIVQTTRLGVENKSPTAPVETRELKSWQNCRWIG